MTGGPSLGKRRKIKSFIAHCPGVFNGSFRAPICKSGNISGPRCSQIQVGFNASPFSGPNNAGSSSAGNNVHSILNDPELRSLERLLRVKAKVELRLPGRLLDKPAVSVSANKAGGCGPLLRVNSTDCGVGVGSGSESLLEHHVSDLSEHHATVCAANEVADESERVTGLLEVRQLDSSKFVGSAAVHAGGGVGDLVGFPASDVGGRC